MDEFYSAEPGVGTFVPTANQQAFAAYEDAWVQREATGRTSPDLLVTALKAREVPVHEYAPDTRLHRALFESWEHGRRPTRMHGVILKYRFGRLRDGLSSHSPEQFELPDRLRPASKWGLWDEEELPFRPSGLFTARVGAWHEAAEDDDGDNPLRAIPVWLDTSSRPEQTPVMVGRELAGHSDLPERVHRQVFGASKRGRRIVVTGDLWIKRRKDGSYRIKKLLADLPKRKG